MSNTQILQSNIVPFLTLKTVCFNFDNNFTKIINIFLIMHSNRMLRRCTMPPCTNENYNFCRDLLKLPI